MNKHMVLGVIIGDRLKNSVIFQEIISKYGCIIKARIGLHNVTENLCSTNGLVLLEIYGDEGQALELENLLKEVEGFEVRKMVFRHQEL